MLDRAYRQRLEADLARWEADGVITPAVGAAIRMALPSLAPGINIPVVLGIVGGLLIAAAFLAFVAAHWIELARLARVAILFSGTVAAFGIGGIVFLLPFLFMPGFQEMVLANPEMQRLYEFKINLGPDAAVYLAPLLYVLALYSLWRMPRISFDLLYAASGLLFSST